MATPAYPPQEATDDAGVEDEGFTLTPVAVTDRRRPAQDANLPQEGSYAAAKIARHRRFQAIPWWVSGVLLVVNIVQPILYMRALGARREIALMDANSNLLVSPLLEPMRSDKVQQILFKWATKAFFERTPDGFSHPDLLESYFDKVAREQAQAEWQSQQEQARAKQLFQDYDPFHIQIQAREASRLRVRIDGQLRVSARDNGRDVVEPPVSQAVEFTFRVNPDMGGSRFFPLVVERWRRLPDPLPLPGS